MINEKGKVTFKQAWIDFWKGYVDFGGRTTRAGYWWMQLLFYVFWFAILLIFGFQFVSLLGVWSATSFSGALAGFASGMIFWLILVAIIGLIVLLPSIALWVRRLRDAGLTNWGIVVLVLVDVVLSLNDNTTIWTSLITVISFVITLLPSDNLTTQSDSSFVKFFLRERKVTSENTTDIDRGQE